MKTFAIPQSDIWPWTPHRCFWCTRRDTIPMPAGHLPDKLIGLFGFVPIRCRACKGKFYRWSGSVPKRPPQATDVGGCQRDPAETRQRVERLIRAAEGAHPRKG